MTANTLRTFGFLSAIVLLSVGASGCGVDLSEVFASSDNNNTAGSGPGGGGGKGGSGGSGGSGTTSEGGGTTGSTTGEGASTGSTTTGNTTTSSTTTSSTTTSSTTTTTPTGLVDCGNGNECSVPDNICCWDKWGVGTGNDNSGECKDAPVSNFDCNTEIVQGGVQTVISCQTAAVCGDNQQCCGDVVTFQAQGQNISYYPSVECRDSCTWPTRIMCANQGSTAECPVISNNGQQVQTVCKTSTLLPNGFLVCGTP